MRSEDCLFNVLRNYFAMGGSDLALGVIEVENIPIFLNLLTIPSPKYLSLLGLNLRPHYPVPPLLPSNSMLWLFLVHCLYVVTGN